MFEDLFEADSFPNLRPLLAHYTSVSTLEQILRYDQVWMSNPLFMNDVDEIRWGMLAGQRIFTEGEKVVEAACGSDRRYQALKRHVLFCFERFVEEHAFDVYALCFSLHDAEVNRDGLLSMWRGYANNGEGAALIIDTEQIPFRPGSPLILSKVTYATTDQREAWLRGKVEQLARLVHDLSDDHLDLAAHVLFERIKLFSLFTKHKGFDEEREWRLVYLPDLDKAGKFKPMLDYHLGPRGLEPKLKLHLPTLGTILENNVTLEALTRTLLLGPALSSELARRTFIRMLDRVQKPSLRDKVAGSSIPFRSSAR
jgi:hypothetical protein